MNQEMRDKRYYKVAYVHRTAGIRLDWSEMQQPFQLCAKSERLYSEKEGVDSEHWRDARGRMDGWGGWGGWVEKRYDECVRTMRKVGLSE